MKQYIYADNAATTKLDKDAFEAMKPYFLDEYGNVSQPYSFSRTAKKNMAKARNIIADCINAEPDEIYFTSGGTESDNWAIKGTVLTDTTKKTVITSKIEHRAILNSCRFVESLGNNVLYMPVDKSGTVLISNLKNNIRNSASIISIMLANNEIGTIQPIRELCDIAHSTGSLFHTDAVQAVGHINIDVKELGVDMLSASAHKFNGPKGIGFLYIKKGTEIVSYASGGAQERNLRAGTENIASIVGMAVALKKNISEIEKNTNLILKLEDILIGKLNLENINFVRNGAKNHTPGNISLSFKNAEGEAILHRLDLMGICISTGSACDSVNTQISHVLKAINLDESYAKGTIRISLGKDNTLSDVKTIADSLIKILKR